MNSTAFYKLNVQQFQRYVRKNKKKFAKRYKERKSHAAVQCVVFPIDAHFNVQFPIGSDCKENYVQRGMNLSVRVCNAFTLITYAKIFQSEIIVRNATWNKNKGKRAKREKDKRRRELYSEKSDCKKSDVNATESFSIF